MGHSLGKDPSEVQQAVINMPQSQAITAAQSVPGPYMASQDPFNYTGFTQYDNQSPVTGYDWWAPGNPTVTQNLPGGGSVTTNPAVSGVPRRTTPPTMADYSAQYQRTPSLGNSGPALSQATPNASTTGVQNSPALDAYINMMGGGNNYGAVIGQQQNTPTPNTPASTTPTDHLGTRYGVWTQNENGEVRYDPQLPWGLKPYSIDGAQYIGFGPDYAPTDLKWDYTTGHLVGGDQLADAYRSQWESIVPWGSGNNGANRLRRTGVAPPPNNNQMTPFWWESAMDPNFVHSTYKSFTPDEGYAWHFAQQPPANLKLPNIHGNVYYGDQLAPGYGGDSAPQANLGLGTPNIGGGTGGGQGTSLSGGGGYASGGYGAGYGGNPWGGLNGIEDAMTSASAFGRRRRG